MTKAVRMFGKPSRTLWGLIALVMVPALADARVTQIQISSQTTAFGGYAWPGVGQYERIVGVATAEVDPADLRNALIVDIGLAQAQPGPGQPGKDPTNG